MLQQILEKYYSENKSLRSTTLKHYVHAIVEFFAFFAGDIQNIRQNNIEEWLEVLENREKNKGGVLSPSTIHGYLAGVKHFFNYCVEEDLLDSNPAARICYPVTNDHVPLILHEWEIFRIIDAAKGNLRDQALLSTLYFTGVRPAELVDIEIDDIDWQLLKIDIRLGKGLKERWVFFSEVCKVRLENYLQQRSVDSPYLFSSRKNKWLSIWAVEDIVEKYVRLAGFIKHITPRNFRYSFATRLVEKEFEIKEIARLLGHEDIDKTRRYIALAESFLKREYDKYKH